MQSFPLSKKPTLMITLCLVIVACLWVVKVVALTKYSDCDPKSPGCGVPDYMVGVYQSGIAFSLARPIMRVVDEYIEERGVVPKDNASAGLLPPGEYKNSFVYDGYGIDVSSKKPVLKSIRWVSAGTLTGKIVIDFGDGAYPGLADQSLYLARNQDGWTCRSSVASNAKHLVPKMCR